MIFTGFIDTNKSTFKCQWIKSLADFVIDPGIDSTAKGANFVYGRFALEKAFIAGPMEIGCAYRTVDNVGSIFECLSPK